MSGQEEAWESFYSENRRPWRGVSDIGDVPFPPGGRILEIGCGNGKTAIALSKKGFSVTGVDLSGSAVGMCRELLSDSGEFIRASVTDLPFDDDTFDGAVAFHVLEHLTDDEMQLADRELYRVLRAGSHLLVRCFAKGDMRSEKGDDMGGSTVIRGNGILYHYYDQEELISKLPSFGCVSVVTREEPTRFGTVRRRIVADLVRT